MKQKMEIQEMYLVKYGWARGQHAALEPGSPAEKKRGRE